MSLCLRSENPHTQPAQGTYGSDKVRACPGSPTPKLLPAPGTLSVPFKGTCCSLLTRTPRPDFLILLEPPTLTHEMPSLSCGGQAGNPQVLS